MHDNRVHVISFTTEQAVGSLENSPFRMSRWHHARYRFIEVQSSERKAMVAIDTCSDEYLYISHEIWTLIVENFYTYIVLCKIFCYFISTAMGYDCHDYTDEIWKFWTCIYKLLDIYC